MTEPAHPGPADDAPAPRRPFVAGMIDSTRSLFTATMFGTFLGYGALCHDLGFSLTWALVSTALVFAGPAQLILVTTLASGASLAQAAVAVGISGMRLLPMTVALLPMLRTPSTKLRDLVLPAHFVSVSIWVETQRLAPRHSREQRVAFCNGLGVGMTIIAAVGTLTGFLLAAQLPPLLGAAVLALTPLLFLCSTIANARTIADRVSFAAGLAMAPLFIWLKVPLAMLLAALLAGTLGYAAHRVAGRALMGATIAETGPYLALILVGYLPNEVWRMLGVVASHGVDENSGLMVWVRGVATAVLAGVIAQLIVTPAGVLAQVPLSIRLGAMGVGLVAFFATRRSVPLGVVAGEAALMAGAWWSGI